MKICMIGNSHIASLKQGWDMVGREFAGVELVFFAAPRGRMAGLKVEGDRLVARSAQLAGQLSLISGGLSEIVPHDYDAIVLYGLGLLVPRLPAGTSSALRRRAAADYVTDGLMQKTLLKLRQITDKRVFIAPRPLTGPGFAPTGRAMMAYSVLLDSLDQAFGDPQVRLLAQPGDSFTPDLETLATFLEGSVQLPTLTKPVLGVTHPDGENRHMNAEFGVLWLRENLAQVIAG